MKITLDASEIETALSMYIGTKYPALAGTVSSDDLADAVHARRGARSSRRDG